jgi:sulfide:quinone oxidoreductase
MSPDRVEDASDRKPRVLIAGGGIAGLEALMALRDLAEDRVEITLAAPQPDFVYKPLTVEEPFSAQAAERRALEPLVGALEARFVQHAIARVRPEDHVAELDDGSAEGYDALVVCVGARAVAAFRDAITFRADRQPPGIDELLGGRDKATRHIAFVVPPAVTWPLPIYELALLTRRRAEELGLTDLRITIVTPESGALIIFGTVASEAVDTLLRARDIAIVGGTRVRESDDGELILTPGDKRLEADVVLALPELRGPGIAGLPADDQGFIPIDEHARVNGAADVYAAGDGTTFPIKQGGLGTQQADAAAEHIAARFGGPIDPQPFAPVLRGQLLTGDESLHLRQGLTGGGGEGVASPDYLWWPPHKVSGRYLAPWLEGDTPHRDPTPPRHPIDVEVALPREWHREPMALDPYEPIDLD